jgi:spore germination protein PE
MSRVSVIGDIKVLAILFESILQIGDNVSIDSKIRLIAVQREVPAFKGDEMPFERFRVFQRPIPQLPAAEDLRMWKTDSVPEIVVGRIKVLSISSSGIVQAGSNRFINLESRIKHFRQFLPRITQ